MTTQIIDIKKSFEKNLNLGNKNVKIKKIMNIINSNIEKSYIKYEFQNKKKIINENPKIEIEIKKIPEIILNDYKSNYQNKHNDFRDNLYNKFGIKKINNFIYKDIDLKNINFNNLKYFENKTKNLIISIINKKFKHQLDSNINNIDFELKKFINLKYIPYDDMFLASYEYKINNKIGFLSIEFDINNNLSDNIFDNIYVKNIFDDFKLNFNINKNNLTKTKYISNENNFFNIQNDYYQHIIDIY
jgi:hypothetical protein